MPKVSITAYDKLADNQLGYYTYFDNNPVEIGILSNGDHILNTTAHEIGHYIDHQALGKGKWSSLMMTMDSGMGKYMTAIENSEAYKALDKAWETGKLVLKGSSMTVGLSRETCAYYLSQQELWARAYAQYIANKSGNAAMLKELKKLQSSIIPSQWSDEDFIEIEKAIDELFKERGWLK